MQQTIVLEEKKWTQILRPAWVKILGASLFLAAAAQIAVPLPTTSVLVTLQTLAVLVIGIVLGRKYAALAILAYFAEICCGMPFLSGGAVEPWALVGARAGYLWGFLIQAYGIGLYCEKQAKLSYLGVWLVSSTLCMLTLALGSLWLSMWLGWQVALAMGFMPFVVGELLKSGCAAYFAVQYRKAN